MAFLYLISDIFIFIVGIIILKISYCLKHKKLNKDNLFYFILLSKSGKFLIFLSFIGLFIWVIPTLIGNDWLYPISTVKVIVIMIYLFLAGIISFYLDKKILSYIIHK